jgi:branched-chain amino acid transport system ATP-binding protein
MSSRLTWGRTISVLRVEGLNVYHGEVQVLFDVSLAVHPGEIVSIVGANAAGKTTLLLAISGLLKKKTGRIRFEEEPIDGRTPNAIVDSGIVHIPQGRRVFPMLSVEENLEVGAYTPRSRQDRKGLVQEMYGLFPRLHTLRGQLAGSLSGGEQQMLAIARGLMSRPKLLTVDEPSLGLAPILAENTFKMIERINRDGVAILLVEQNVVKALTLAHRAFVIENGRMVMEGAGSELLKDEHLKKAYLGM